MVLAVHGGHNASAALVTTKNGEVESWCVEAERIDRIKMSPGCERYEGDDFSSKNKAFWIRNHKSDLKELVLSVMRETGCDYSDVDTVVVTDREVLKRIPEELKTKEVICVPHHFAHASLAYYSSKFDEAITIVCDGSGEKNDEGGYEVQSAWRCKGGLISNIQTTYKNNPYQYGIGNAYELFTYWLGYGYNGCGTTMALAAFSHGQSMYSDSIFELNDPNNIFLSDKFVNLKEYVDRIGYVKEGSLAYNLTHEKMLRGIELPIGYRIRHYDEDAMQDVYINMANDIQLATEKAVVKYVENAIAKVGDFSGNVCLGGGTFLNCRLNTLIREISGVKDVYVPTAPGDGGLALGAALYALFSKIRRCNVRDIAYIGRNIHIAPIGENSGVSYEKVCDIFQKVARLLSKGYLVGWCQGRSEFGPRALGNRSLLASAIDENSPNQINGSLKHREAFRPFAPVVLETEFEKYFEGTRPIPYMLETRKIRVEWREKLSAVTHVDGSARVQTVTESNNPNLYALLTEYSKMTGFSVLINTSLNRRGEPIVDTAMDAINLLIKSQIDYLVINNAIYYRIGEGYEAELR